MKRFLTLMAKLLTGLRRIPIGGRIALIAALLVFGRYAWVMMERPRHRVEIADAYSVRLFYGTPQSDSSGSRVCYVATSDVGFSLYLINVKTGERKDVFQENGLGPWGSSFDLVARPWAPDDRLLAFTTGPKLHLADPNFDSRISTVSLPAEIRTMAWLNSSSFVFIGHDNRFYKFEKGNGSFWTNSFVLQTDQPDASTQNAPRESAAKAFDGSNLTKWYNNSRPRPWWLQYEFADPKGHIISEYAVTSANDAPERDPEDWEFAASNDGNNWVKLDSQRSQTFPSRLMTKSYAVDNSKSFRFYRLNITKNKGGEQHGVQLQELSLRGKTNADWNSVALNIRGSPYADANELTVVGSNRVSWVSGGCLWTLNLPSEKPAVLLDLREAGQGDASIYGFSYSQSSGEYLLNCAEEQKRWVSRLGPESSEPQQITAVINEIRDAAWLKNGTDWIGRQDSTFSLRKQKTQTVILPTARVESFTASSDAKQVFFVGTLTNEPSASIWRYDPASGESSCVVPYADRPSPLARRIEPVRDYILSDSGKYSIYLPADFYENRKQKRPLVIGYTDFGFAARGAYGRMWAPAMAACGAFVVIVNRPAWFEGIETWGETVTAAFEDIAARLPVDRRRVFLFGVSAETTHISQFLKDSPEPWRGVMLLNPTGLPDLTGTSPSQTVPKLLISVGELEGRGESLKRFQKKALGFGMLTEVVVAKGEKHHLVGNAAQRERTRAMANFIFGD